MPPSRAARGPPDGPHHRPRSPRRTPDLPSPGGCRPPEPVHHRHAARPHPAAGKPDGPAPWGRWRQVPEPGTANSPQGRRRRWPHGLRLRWAAGHLAPVGQWFRARPTRTSAAHRPHVRQRTSIPHPSHGAPDRAPRAAGRPQGARPGPTVQGAEDPYGRSGRPRAPAGPKSRRLRCGQRRPVPGPRCPAAVRRRRPRVGRTAGRGPTTTRRRPAVRKAAERPVRQGAVGRRTGRSGVRRPGWLRRGRGRQRVRVRPALARSPPAADRPRGAWWCARQAATRAASPGRGGRPVSPPVPHRPPPARPGVERSGPRDRPPEPRPGWWPDAVGVRAGRCGGGAGRGAVVPTVSAGCPPGAGSPLPRGRGAPPVRRRAAAGGAGVWGAWRAVAAPAGCSSRSRPPDRPCSVAAHHGGGHSTCTGSSSGTGRRRRERTNPPPPSRSSIRLRPAGGSPR